MDSTWDTKFWKYHHFAWYLYLMEANTALASGHFQNGGNIMPNLDFQEQLALQLMYNTIGTETGNIVRPM